MGCSTSNVRKINHPDIPVEERVIQAGERLIVFNKNKLEDILDLISSISFPIELTHYDELCNLLAIQPQTPTGVFLKNLITNKLISTKQLRYLTILLSEADSSIKLPFVFSSDKTLFLATVSELFHLSVEVIPKHLQSVDSSVGLYVEQLRPATEEFIRQMKLMSIEEIRERLKEVDLNSREIRVKMFVLSKQFESRENFDLKIEKFKVQKEEEELEYLTENKEKEEKTENVENEEKEEKLENVENTEKEEKCEKVENAAKVDCVKSKLESEGQRNGVEENLIEDLKNLEEVTEKDIIKELNDETRAELKSFLDKIPDEGHVDLNFSESGSLTEDSFISSVRSDSTAKFANSEEHEVHIEEQKKPENLPKDAPKLVEKLPEHQESKIPFKPSSKIMTHLKAVDAFSNPMKKSTTEEKIPSIKSPKSIIVQPGRTAGHRDTLPEQKLVNTPVKLDPCLSESSILRSKIQKLTEPKVHHDESAKKESKISMKKETKPVIVNEVEEPEPVVQFQRRNSKIGMIKGKK